jgi:hypothetical protein
LLRWAGEGTRPYANCCFTQLLTVRTFPPTSLIRIWGIVP